MKKLTKKELENSKRQMESAIELRKLMYGQTGSVLLALFANGGAMRTSEIERYISGDMGAKPIAQPNITTAIGKLKKAGFIYAVGSKQDGHAFNEAIAAQLVLLMGDIDSLIKKAAAHATR